VILRDAAAIAARFAPKPGVARRGER